MSNSLCEWVRGKKRTPKQLWIFLSVAPFHQPETGQDLSLSARFRPSCTLMHPEPSNGLANGSPGNRPVSSVPPQSPWKGSMFLFPGVKRGEPQESHGSLCGFCALVTEYRTSQHKPTAPRKSSRLVHAVVRNLLLGSLRPPKRS